MKKLNHILTFILITSLSFFSFDKPKVITNITDISYYCVYSINHKTKKLFISNVFSSNVYPNTVSASKYMENELNVKLESYRNTTLLSHKESNYVYDDRLEKIKWAKEKNYGVFKFNVIYKNGNFHTKY